MCAIVYELYTFWNGNIIYNKVLDVRIVILDGTRTMTAEVCNTSNNKNDYNNNRRAKRKMEIDNNNKEINANMWNKKQQIGSIGTITFAIAIEGIWCFMCT